MSRQMIRGDGFTRAMALGGAAHPAEDIAQSAGTTTGLPGRAARIHICNRLYSVALGGLAIVFAVCLLIQQAIAAATYPVVDAGYRLARHGKLYWLDNNRVLFYGGSARQDSQSASKAGANPGSGGTYIWNLTSATLEHISEWEITCYHPDYSTWSLVRPDKNEFRSKAGPFGQEKETEKQLLSQEELFTQRQMGAAVRSNFTCKTHSRSELVPPISRYRYVAVLRDGDGYLDLGSGDTSERQAFPRNLTLYQARTGKAVQLAMTWDEDFSPSGVVYSMYLSAYILPPRIPQGGPLGHIREWPKDLPFVVYLLWADGRVKPISIPYLQPGNFTLPRPTKAGWIFGGGNVYNSLGLYLFDGKRISKLDAGGVSEIAVTPDGCKAAVGIQNKHLEMGTPINLRVFDLCGGGR